MISDSPPPQERRWRCRRPAGNFSYRKPLEMQWDEQSTEQVLAQIWCRRKALESSVLLTLSTLTCLCVKKSPCSGWCSLYLDTGPVCCFGSSVNSVCMAGLWVIINANEPWRQNQRSAWMWVSAAPALVSSWSGEQLLCPLPKGLLPSGWSCRTSQPLTAIQHPCQQQD